MGQEKEIRISFKEKKLKQFTYANNWIRIFDFFLDKSMWIKLPTY